MARDLPGTTDPRAEAVRNATLAQLTLGDRRLSPGSRGRVRAMEAPRGTLELAWGPSAPACGTRRGRRGDEAMPRPWPPGRAGPGPCEGDLQPQAQGLPRRAVGGVGKGRAPEGRGGAASSGGVRLLVGIGLTTPVLAGRRAPAWAERPEASPLASAPGPAAGEAAGRDQAGSGGEGGGPEEEEELDGWREVPGERAEGRDVGQAAGPRLPHRPLRPCPLPPRRAGPLTAPRGVLCAGDARLAHLQRGRVHGGRGPGRGRLQGRGRLPALGEQGRVFRAAGVHEAGLQAPGRGSHPQLCQRRYLPAR